MLKTEVRVWGHKTCVMYGLSDAARGLDVDLQVPRQANRRALVALSEKMQGHG